MVRLLYLIRESSNPSEGTTELYNMIRRTLLLFGILCGYVGYGQTLTPEVYTASVGYFISTNNSLSWTLGESLIETYTGTNNILTQGFQQTTISITGIQENTDHISISVYPNPADGYVMISPDANQRGEMKLDLYDLSGKLLHSELFHGNLKLDLSSYPNDIYMVRISDESNKHTNTYKLIKTN